MSSDERTEMDLDDLLCFKLIVLKMKAVTMF